MGEVMTWPDWKNVRKIGEGSFGAVYEIERDVFGKIEKAALKVISIPQSESDIEELVSDGYDVSGIAERYQSYLESIVQEYSLMAEMKGNSNIVDCDDLKYFPREDSFGWDILIKMELLTPLTKAIGKNITEEQVIQLGIDICNALVLCKSRNIVHRDIKPQNIFLSKHGQYKLGDFGIAKVADKTSSGTKTGTFSYMAPEVYNNQPYGSASDIYSLGIVLYWMLNERRTPFLPLPPQVPTVTIEEEARRRRFDGETIPEPAHGSARLKEIVLKACAYDPINRYSDATQLRDDLKSLLEQQSIDLTVRETTSKKNNVVSENAKDSIPNEKKKETPKLKHTNASNQLKDTDGTQENDLSKKEKDEGRKRTKKFILMGVLGIIAVLAIIILVSGGNKKGNNSNDTLPTERTMTSDAATILKDENIDGGIIELNVIDSENHEKYQTYVANCEIVVKTEDGTEVYIVTLVYEQNNDGWNLSRMSKLE